MVLSPFVISMVQPTGISDEKKEPSCHACNGHYPPSIVMVVIEFVFRAGFLKNLEFGYPELDKFKNKQ